MAAWRSLVLADGRPGRRLQLDPWTGGFTFTFLEARSCVAEVWEKRSARRGMLNAERASVRPGGHAD